VATVSASGTVTAVAAGTALISATVEGVTGSTTATVSALGSSVLVSPQTANLLVGGTQQLTATARDASGNTLTGRAVTWSTSNASIATISSTGLVTAVAAGSATLTATVEGVQGMAAITVSSPVRIVPGFSIGRVGGLVPFTAYLVDANGRENRNVSFTWGSGNTSRARIGSDGVAMLLDTGTVEILAETGGIRGSFTFTVSPLPLSTIEVNSRPYTTQPALTALAYRLAIDSLVALAPSAGYCNRVVTIWQGLTNQAICQSGTNSQIAKKISARLVVDPTMVGVWHFKAGVDFGSGGGIYINGQPVVFSTADLYGISGSFTLQAGTSTITVIGFEGCCDGDYGPGYFSRDGSSWFIARSAPNIVPVQDGMTEVNARSRSRLFERQRSSSKTWSATAKDTGIPTRDSIANDH
jgi:hypothetical protein